MKRKLIVISALFTLVVPLIMTGCQKTEAIPETPFSAKYAVNKYIMGQGERVLTTDTAPIKEDDCVRLINYWWRENDEEGNIQWLRRTEDYYYVLLPLSDGTITVRIIKDGQIAETVHVYEEN